MASVIPAVGALLKMDGEEKKMCNFGQSNHVPQISPISWLNAVGDQPSGPEPGLPSLPSHSICNPQHKLSPEQLGDATCNTYSAAKDDPTP